MKSHVPMDLVISESEFDSHSTNGVIEVFYSFRSPYSQLIMDRVLYLCHLYDKKLLFRPILPMVARKLKVPSSKMVYIARDAIREAKNNWAIPFGCIADPGIKYFIWNYISDCVSAVT